MRIPILFGMIILLSSCAETTPNYHKPTVSSWRGGAVTQLLDRWGTPDQKITNFNGNTLYIYRSSNNPASLKGSPGFGVHLNKEGKPVLYNEPPQAANPVSLTCITAFEVDKTGEIIGVQTQGQGCYADKMIAKQKSNPG